MFGTRGFRVEEIVGTADDGYIRFVRTTRENVYGVSTECLQGVYRVSTGCLQGVYLVSIGAVWGQSILQLYYYYYCVTHPHPHPHPHPRKNGTSLNNSSTRSV